MTRNISEGTCVDLYDKSELYLQQGKGEQNLRNDTYMYINTV